MKTIIRFINALEMPFRATDIGAYLAPLFRPMVTEQYRLHPICVVPGQARPLFTCLDGAQRGRTELQ